MIRIERTTISILYFSRKNTPLTPKNPKIEPTHDVHDAVGPKIAPIIPEITLNPPRLMVDLVRAFFNSRLITKRFIVKESEVSNERITSKNQSFRVKIEVWKENVFPGIFLTGM